MRYAPGWYCAAMVLLLTMVAYSALGANTKEGIAEVNGTKLYYEWRERALRSS